jgi:hypothetical protein
MYFLLYHHVPSQTVTTAFILAHQLLHPAAHGGDFGQDCIEHLGNDQAMKNADISLQSTGYGLNWNS